jgi:hypothetical protein
VSNANYAADAEDASLGPQRAGLAEWPEHPFALFRLGHGLSYRDRPDEAASVWERVVRLLPKDRAARLESAGVPASKFRVGSVGTSAISVPVAGSVGQVSRDARNMAAKVARVERLQSSRSSCDLRMPRRPVPSSNGFLLSPSRSIGYERRLCAQSSPRGKHHV